MKVVLVDFGATSVKSVALDLTDPTVIIDQLIVPSPSQTNISNLPGHYEVGIESYRRALRDTAGNLAQRHSAAAIYICSEMHGFAISEVGTLPKNYISWKDSRSTIHGLDQAKFLKLSGMRLRPGLPYATLASIDLDPSLQYKVYTLVDCILDSATRTNITLAAGTGFVDLENKCWSNKLLPNNVTGNPISIDVTQRLGLLDNIPVYAGIGDLQSALTGAGLGIETMAVFNLGTGSQVAVVSECPEEVRMLPDNTVVGVITHIPSGRAINVIAELVDSIGKLVNGSDIFWKLWGSLTASTVLAASLEVDLNVFESAWRYTDSKTIKLREGTTTVTDLVAGVALAWTRQYIQALDILDTYGTIPAVTVTGGLAHRSPWLLEVFSILDSGRNYTLCNTITGEETLDGLLKIALGKIK